MRTWGDGECRQIGCSVSGDLLDSSVPLSRCEFKRTNYDCLRFKLYHDIPLFSDTLSNPLDLKGIDLQEDCRPSVFVGSVELGSDLGLPNSFWLFRV